MSLFLAISVARIASRRLKLRYLSLLIRQQASAVVLVLNIHFLIDNEL